MLLADVVLWPDRSIIKQSYDARERKGDPNLPFHLAHGSLNGDGFGIGWFSVEERREKDPTPCVFTSITPAWNNENLARLACKIVSPLIFAHVRAAYPGMPVSEQNCHPFMYGRYMWMHNGVVAGFSQIKRPLLAMLSDVAYNSIQSFHSDSAVSFALFLHQLPNPFTPQAPEVLLRAMQETINTIGQLQRQAGITATSLLNYVVSDGTCLLSTRFVMPETADAASLYYAEGAAFSRTTETATAVQTKTSEGCAVCPPGGTTASSSILHEASYDLQYAERGAQVAFVASEPITGSSADWVAVPKNHTLVITREKGGYINIMRTFLTVPGAPPPMELGSPQHSLYGNGQGLNLRTDPVSMGKSTPRNGGLPGTPNSWSVLSSQAEIAVCLEAVSRGLSAKSRPWVAQGQPLRHQLSTTMGLEGAPTGLTNLISDGVGADLRIAANGPPSTAMSRHGSITGNEYLPAGFLPSNAGGVMNGSASPMPATESAQDPLMFAHDGGTPHFQRLVSHTGPVLAMAIHEESSRLYTASSDCTIKTWSLRDNSCLGSVTAGKKPITCMQLRDRWLYTGAGRKMRVWDTARNCVCVDVVRIANHSGNIRCLIALPGKIYLGCQVR